ncbi:TauD/TfdA family dioxygenase [soil metagenome]
MSNTLSIDRPAVTPQSQSQPQSQTPSRTALHEAFRITLLDASLGAEVTGLDATKPVPAEQILALKKALLERHVLVLKRQQIDDAQFERLASYFGAVFRPPANVPVLGSDPYGGNTPDIVRVSNLEGGVLGHDELSAHADHHWTPVPSSGSLLYGIEVPSEGGDTTWYNLAAAWDALDDATQREIDSLKLITYNPFLRKLKPLASGFPLYRTQDIEPLTPFEAHPLVRTHPDSGRRVLHLGARTEVEIVGAEPAYGAALIARLRAHLLQPRFAYTHRWTVGDIVYLDNQATLHARSAFDNGERRLLKRISLSGSRPF